MHENANSINDSEVKKRREQEDENGSIYLGPMQISDEDNEWNKRSLKIAAKELRAVPVAV